MVKSGKRNSEIILQENASKRAKGLLDDDSASESDLPQEDGSASSTATSSSAASNDFKINADFARRHEHNKRREELQRLQERYGDDVDKRRRVDEHDASEESSSSEDEDEDGVLVSGDLDTQIEQTLLAIRKKDPRVYDKDAKFYAELESETEDGDPTTDNKSHKPIYLNDYHRKKLLGDLSNAEGGHQQYATYEKEQENLKASLVKAANEIETVDDSLGRGAVVEDDDFLKAKPVVKSVRADATKAKIDAEDIAKADENPEAFLTNFMAARAWVSTESSQMQPFESDDDEDDARADRFEEAYNLRFEDAAQANEKLLSHARDTVAKYSVRKEFLNPRKRARESDRAKKDTEKQIRTTERARLRKLKLSELESKLNKVKEAAGFNEEMLSSHDLSNLLDEGWDDSHWNETMKEKFGDQYYAGNDATAMGDEASVKPKLRKPKWTDDIEINDLIPDFDPSASDPLECSAKDGSDGIRSSNALPDPKQAKVQARKQRQKLERLVEDQLDVEETLASFSEKHSGHFRYRETSPQTFGLTPDDILLASDSQLNQFAGLKKMAAFREEDKKRKDRKRLGKKARLRQWRKETFGSESGPQQSLADVLQEPMANKSL